MAKKRSPKPMQVAAEPKLMPVRVDLEPEVHDLLRLAAAKARMSMARFARETLSKVLRGETERED